MVIFLKRRHFRFQLFPSSGLYGLEHWGRIDSALWLLVGSSVPEYYLAGCTKDSILNITYDGLNKRILFVAHDDQHPSGDYKVMSLAVDEKKPGRC